MDDGDTMFQRLQSPVSPRKCKQRREGRKYSEREAAAAGRRAQVGAGNKPHRDMAIRNTRATRKNTTSSSASLATLDGWTRLL